MSMPTLDQTEGVWINRTLGGYHYIQEVFDGKTPREQLHQVNCEALITRGSLQPEFKNGCYVASQRVWEANQRYMRVHT